jgi:hypothetical protein
MMALAANGHTLYKYDAARSPDGDENGISWMKNAVPDPL